MVVWRFVQATSCLVALWLPFFALQLLLDSAPSPLERGIPVRRRDDPKAFWRSILFQLAAILVLAFFSFNWWH